MGTPFIDLQTETQRVAAELTTFHDRLVPAFHGVDPAALRAGASLLLEALSRREPGPEPVVGCSARSPAPIGVFAGRLLWSVEVFISVEACGQALARLGFPLRPGFPPPLTLAELPAAHAVDFPRLQARLLEPRRVRPWNALCSVGPLLGACAPETALALLQVDAWVATPEAPLPRGLPLVLENAALHVSTGMANLKFDALPRLLAIPAHDPLVPQCVLSVLSAKVAALAALYRGDTEQLSALVTSMDFS